ncbi:hypothetical protein M427DRAFT_26766 [Gonapodya prolifera JEL478]|uniref:Uncharacterized protein n=1 Tax=Gonapodya prolifera (strain JEL478) TaxID=1344416 RepID=A0A139AZG9_GONPJ|nr:hypothetical protein M427DRAFT_26766 [Gonapodya prolifera JEL478]|eukprot:KXS22126.1 hypothetical protein M427DRAFT_26766 [Gonapodya prolifera JEL478]
MAHAMPKGLVRRQRTGFARTTPTSSTARGRLRISTVYALSSPVSRISSGRLRFSALAAIIPWPLVRARVRIQDHGDPQALGPRCARERLDKLEDVATVEDHTTRVVSMKWWMQDEAGRRDSPARSRGLSQPRTSTPAPGAGKRTRFRSPLPTEPLPSSDSAKPAPPRFQISCYVAVMLAARCVGGSAVEAGHAWSNATFVESVPSSHTQNPTIPHPARTLTILVTWTSLGAYQPTSLTTGCCSEI